MDVPEQGKKPKKTVEKYGFIIEPVGSVAERNHMVNLKSNNLSQKNMDPGQMTLVAMFEYMIGNTDWSVPGRHNMKILKALEFEKPLPYPVPYDFDYTGMVDADYAAPREGLPIRSVRDRYYLGICLPEEHMYHARKLFLEKKDELFRIIQKFPYLDNYEKKYMTKYLKGFYDILESESSFRYNIVDRCKSK